MSTQSYCQFCKAEGGTNYSVSRNHIAELVMLHMQNMGVLYTKAGSTNTSINRSQTDKK